MEKLISHNLQNNLAHLIVTDQSYHSFPKHYHETYSIALITDGAKNFRTKSDKCTLDNSKVVTMNPCEIHSGEAITENGWKQVVLLFDEKSPKIFAEENETKELIFNNTVKTNIKLRAELLELSAKIANADNEMEKEQYYELMMGLLFYSENSIKSDIYNNHQGIGRCIDLIRSESSEKLELETLATHSGMSKFHFIRSFKNSTGMTPHAYLNMVRIERARRLIFSSDKSLAEISAECGFADQAHFSRAYKKVYGTPPGKIIIK